MDNTSNRSQLIDGVTITDTNAGFQLRIPAGMTGKDLKKWKWRNRKAIRVFKDNEEV